MIVFSTNTKKEGAKAYLSPILSHGAISHGAMLNSATLHYNLAASISEGGTFEDGTVIWHGRIDQAGAVSLI